MPKPFVGSYPLAIHTKYFPQIDRNFVFLDEAAAVLPNFHQSEQYDNILYDTRVECSHNRKEEEEEESKKEQRVFRHMSKYNNP
jgi:hypothetical protein